MGQGSQPRGREESLVCRKIEKDNFIERKRGEYEKGFHGGINYYRKGWKMT